MRWIRTTHGDRAHAVAFRNSDTLCGIPLNPHAVEIITLGPCESDRCANCDAEWRKRGRRNRPKRRARDLTTYRPRHSIDDWENL
jgi:zinc finger protein